MQWLGAPKLAEMLNKVMPPLKDVTEEEAPAETPQLPWTLASPGEGSDDMQRWTLSLLHCLSQPRIEPSMHESTPQLQIGISSRSRVAACLVSMQPTNLIVHVWDTIAGLCGTKSSRGWLLQGTAEPHAGAAPGKSHTHPGRPSCHRWSVLSGGHDTSVLAALAALPPRIVFI